MITSPRFMDAALIAQYAFQLGYDEWDNSRKVKREFQGATPKRKGYQFLKRLSKRLERLHYLSIGSLSDPERKMFAAAYDMGLWERQEELENQAGES